MGLRDLGMRQFDEIRIPGHAFQRGDQVRIGALVGAAVELRMRGDLGIEVEVVLAQPLELREIFVMEDRREHASDLAELVMHGLAGGFVLRGQRVQNVGLAHRYEMVSPARAV